VGDVQRLFSMFPPGFPGIALLLLRVSVALTVLLEGYMRQEGLPVWLVAASLLLAILLIAGFVTPILAILAMVVQLAGAFQGSWPTRILVAILSLNALALALLGPGAYSVDALRFGRRVVDLSAGEDE
jgi:putative oxidoreductase